MQGPQHVNQFGSEQVALLGLALGYQRGLTDAGSPAGAAPGQRPARYVPWGRDRLMRRAKSPRPIIWGRCDGPLELSPPRSIVRAMDAALLTAVLGRLDASPLEGGSEEFLLAALDSDEALSDVLGGRPRPCPPRPAASEGKDDVDAARAYLRSVTVEGFRGVGPAATLNFEPGPGLTVVCGRNGSGKSTFAEALEVLLTGQLRRWETHSLVFREGWRSMHASHARVRAELFIEGTAGATVVERDWPDATQDVGKSVAWVQRPREAKTTLKELGWDGPLSS